MTTDQSLSNRLRESAKLGVRRGMLRSNLSIARDPFANQVARTLRTAGVRTVLDVGANVGQYARLLRAAGYDGTIVSVEPLDTAHAQLAKRAERDDAWHTVNVGVGSEPGSTTINIAGNSYSSSIRDMTQTHLDAAADSAYIGTQDIEIVTVPQLIEQFSADPATTFLKVDTQGFEREVLAGATSILDRVAAVQLELSFVELYDGQALFPELTELLAGHGLTLWNLEPGIASDAGRLLQVDGLFVREAGTA